MQEGADTLRGRQIFRLAGPVLVGAIAHHEFKLAATEDFLMGEVRYTSLKKEFPGKADDLFKAAEEKAKWRLKNYKRLASAGE